LKNGGGDQMFLAPVDQVQY
jgi:hypothetical protein